MAIKGKYCLITNDVETTSIINHRLDDNTAEKVYKEPLKKLKTIIISPLTLL